MDSAATTLGILLVAVVIVVGGVLILRLHAFLALLLGALAVAALTSPSAIEREALQRDRLRIERIDATEGVVLLDPRGQWMRVGLPLFLLRPTTEGLAEVAELEIVEIIEDSSERSSRRVVARIQQPSAETSFARDDLVVTASARREAEVAARRGAAQRVASAFGATCGNIGILIAMAAIIGKCLLDSGAADRVVRGGLKLLGERGAPLAFLWSGFLLGIPVFFDTLFYLMIPLGKALGMRTGRNYLLYVLTIVAGGTMAHSLVPPTPGPLFVAEALGVDLGVMILAGCLVGSVTAGCGYLFALALNRRFTLPLRPSPDLSLEELEAIAARTDDQLPPLGLAVLPILLPVLLIGGETILGAPRFASNMPAAIRPIISALGDKNIALILSAAVAMAMLAWQKRARLRELAGAVQAALASGGVIILITAAGGAFGAMLQGTGVASLVRALPNVSPPLVVLLAFCITAAVRTAQGSATVAMITAVGILSGLTASGDLGFHPVYLALAIGCGSKPITWMNDSGFWVIGRMSGMTEAETLKYVTPMVATMGLVGLVVLMIGVTFFPMT